MYIHQRKHQGIEHGQHLGRGWQANATTVFPSGHISPPMQTIFHGPVTSNVLQELLRRTALRRKACPSVDHLDAPLPFAASLSLHTKDLPHLSSIMEEGVIEIGAGKNHAAFQTTMTFLDLFIASAWVRQSACSSSKKSSKSLRVAGVCSLIVTITSPPARWTRRPNS